MTWCDWLVAGVAGSFPIWKVAVAHGPQSSLLFSPSYHPSPHWISVLRCTTVVIDPADNGTFLHPDHGHLQASNAFFGVDENANLS